jgi:uncharacterized membrane protein
MIRNLKMLGVAFAAVLALSAVAATTASAEGKVTCSSYPCKMTGVSAVGNSTFKTEAGTVECKGHAEATINEASSELTLVGTATECKAFGFLGATVNTNGCDGLSTTPKKIGTDQWTATGHMICPAGKTIEITAGTCKLTIGPQTPSSAHTIITNKTEATPDVVELTGSATGINYTVVTDGFGCPFAGTGAKTGASIVQHNPVLASATAGQDVHVG